MLEENDRGGSVTDFSVMGDDDGRFCLARKGFGKSEYVYGEETG